MGDWQRPGLPAWSDVNIDPVYGGSEGGEACRGSGEGGGGQGGLLIDEVMPVLVNLVAS